MPHHSEIKAFFADGEHTFALRWKQLEELEETTKLGCFVVLHNMTQRRVIISKEQRELIRLGLIGGGMAPPEALKLVTRYVEDRPLLENFELACQILEAAIFGSPEWQASDEGKASKARQERLLEQVREQFPDAMRAIFP